MIKSYPYDFLGETIVLAPVMESYVADGTLAVELYRVDESGLPWYEDCDPWCDLTVNLGSAMADCRRAYLDTNNMAGAAQFVSDNGIATDTGVCGSSGWCSYPLYDFDLAKINAVEDVRREWDVESR